MRRRQPGMDPPAPGTRFPSAGTVGKGLVETALLESAAGNRMSLQDRGGH